MSGLNLVNEFIETNKLTEHVKLSDTGVFTTDLGLFDDVVLKPLKIKRETYDALTESTGLFNASLTKVGGELAAGYFGNNPDISELALNYNHGTTVQNALTSVYTRKHGECDGNVVTSITSTDPHGYFQEVQAELIKVFNDLDN